MGTGKGVHFIYFLNQSRPIPVGFGVLIWFLDAGYEAFLIFLLTKPPRGVTIRIADLQLETRDEVYI